MTSPPRSLQLPEELCHAAEERFGGQFARIEDLLVFILQELLRDDADHLTRAEEELLEKRLRDLGYI